MVLPLMKVSIHHFHSFSPSAKNQGQTTFVTILNASFLFSVISRIYLTDCTNCHNMQGFWFCRVSGLLIWTWNIALCYKCLD